MKRYVPFSVLLLATAGVSAQITVTSATFPAVGDTLKLAIDNDPVGIVALTPPGGNQIWDFTSLQVDATENIVYNPANQGSVGAKIIMTNKSKVHEKAKQTKVHAILLRYSGRQCYDSLGF